MTPEEIAAAAKVLAEAKKAEGDNKNTDPPQPGTGDPPPTDPPKEGDGEAAKKKFSQDDVNKLVGTTRTDTRAKTQTDLLSELGLDDLEALKLLVKTSKDKELENMTELEKANAEATRLKGVEEANTAAATLLTEAHGAIEGLLEVRLKELDVPEHILPLLEGMPLVERLKYLNDNGDKFTKEVKKKPETNASSKGGSSSSDQTKAQKQRIADRYKIRQ